MQTGLVPLTCFTMCVVLVQFSLQVSQYDKCYMCRDLRRNVFFHRQMENRQQPQMRLRNAMECTMLPNALLGQTMWGSEIVSLALLAYYYYLYTNRCNKFPAKSEEILTSVACLSHTFSWRGENSEFEFHPSAPALLSLFFLARSTTINGHRNPIALPSITQFFSPTHHSRMFWPTPELLEPSKLIVFGFRIV